MQVIVVGAGIAGLSTAWALTKRGHQVTLLEQGSIPNPLAASGDHHRIIRRAYGKASGYGRAITEAYRAWDELWSDLGESHHDPRGFLCISREAGRRGRAISRRPRGGRLSLRAGLGGSGRCAVAVPRTRHVPLRLRLAGGRGAALPQDRLGHCRLAAQQWRGGLRKQQGRGDRARHGQDRARRRRDAAGPTASSSPPAPGC